MPRTFLSIVATLNRIAIVATIAGRIGMSRRGSAGGRAALRRWRAAVAAAAPGGGQPPVSGTDGPLSVSGGDGRLAAYAAAVGQAPGLVAMFSLGGTGMAWSSYRGGWQQIEIENQAWPWPKQVAVLVALTAGPAAYFAGVFWLFAEGLTGLAGLAIALVFGGAAAGALVWLARRWRRPEYTEFDGQVIRQVFTEGSDDSPDEYRVVIDDGVRATAWDFEITPEQWAGLAAGTLVHVRLNLRRREQVAVTPAGLPAVPPALAGIAAAQQRAGHGGLPDPAALVTMAEAAAIVGRPVHGKHIGGLGLRVMSWQPETAVVPILRVEVRLRDGRPAPPAARPVPGGYLLGRSAVVQAGSLTAVLHISGRAPAGSEAALASVLPAVSGRLGRLASLDLNQY